MGTLFRSQALFDVYRRLGAAYDLPLLLERTGERGGEASGFAPGAQADGPNKRASGKCSVEGFSLDLRNCR